MEDAGEDHSPRTRRTGGFVSENRKAARPGAEMEAFATEGLGAPVRKNSSLHSGLAHCMRAGRPRRFPESNAGTPSPQQRKFSTTSVMRSSLRGPDEPSEGRGIVLLIGVGELLEMLLNNTISSLKGNKY